jgi:hypothetical protein
VGVNATLGRYLKDARDDGGLDAKVSDNKLEWQGEDIEEGTTKCEGVDDPELLLAYWKNASDPDALPEVTTGDFNDLRLIDNGAAITLYYGDPDADIPKPVSAANLAALGAADGGASLPNPEDANTTTTSPAESTTTAPGDTTTTTAAGGTTTTTAG